MTTRKLIKLLREHATGSDRLDALCFKLAGELEEHAGGPEPTAPEPYRAGMAYENPLAANLAAKHGF